MALKPPSRGGSNSGIRQGINRRRKRLSEMLVKQTYGGAADSVLTDYVLASPASENKTGSVTGSIAYTGTIVGKEGEPGAVAGTTTYSGTVAGSKGAQGATVAEIVYSGVITGTKYDPDTPTAPVRRGGSSYYAPRPNIPQRKPEPVPLVRKSGKVSGSIALSGVITGRKSSAGRALTAPITYRCEMRGSKTASGVTVARITTRATVRGTGITTVTTTELRRLRDDADLMLML